MRPVQETQVLVVGAGPVGLYTAIRLADVGLRVEIIDQGDRPASQSYACTLHPDSLDLLAGAGLADAAAPRWSKGATALRGHRPA